MPIFLKKVKQKIKKQSKIFCHLNFLRMIPILLAMPVLRNSRTVANRKFSEYPESGSTDCRSQGWMTVTTPPIRSSTEIPSRKSELSLRKIRAKMIVKTGLVEMIILTTPRGICWRA